MKKTISSPDAATGKTTAKQEKYEKKMAKYLANKARKEQKNESRDVEVGVKIDRTVIVCMPGCPFGKTFYINGKSAIYVQDLCEIQNSHLFEEGLKLIDTKVSPTRRSYLSQMLGLVLPNANMNLDDMMRKSCDNNIGLIIALVCDIALHKDKKLANPQAYDKDFNKYVANLFREYQLDGAFQRYVHLGEDTVPVPEFLVSPEMYNWAAATA